MKYKVCKKCNKILLLNEDNFYKSKETKDGFFNICKKCNRITSFNSSSRRRFKKYVHNITIEMYEEMINYFDGKCAYTGVPLDEANFSFDHVFPNSLDGMHAIYNLVPCHKNINIRKQDKNLLRWYPSTEYYSIERLNKIYRWHKYAYEKYIPCIQST